MDIVEETLAIKELKEVDIEYLRRATFYHPIKAALPMLYPVEPCQPSKPHSHGNPVRRLIWLDIDGERVLEGPILAAYCDQCQILFYAYNTEQSVAEVESLERLYGLTAK